MVFHAFITAFGTVDRPLILFLDDLQWADVASLELLRNLLTMPDTRHLLVFGAYRDNEVDPAHPLVAAVDQIREAGVSVQEMVLGTISVEDIVAFTADAVRRPAAEVRPLARLLYDKTGGNPFFLIQFFRELVRGRLLYFDAGAWRWRWDLARIRERATRKTWPSSWPGGSRASLMPPVGPCGWRPAWGTPSTSRRWRRSRAWTKRRSSAISCRRSSRGC